MCSLATTCWAGRITSFLPTTRGVEIVRLWEGADHTDMWDCRSNSSLHPSKAIGVVRGCWPYWLYWRDCQHITMMKVDKTRTMLTHQRCQWTNAPAAYIYVDTIPQSSKSNLVPRTQILGPFGSPKKRVNFDICNKRRKWVFCDSVNLTH